MYEIRDMSGWALYNRTPSFTDRMDGWMDEGWRTQSLAGWYFNWITWNVKCDCSIVWLEISASLPDSRYNNTVLGDLFVFTVVDPLIPHLWPTFTTQLSLVPPGPPMVVNDPFYCIKYYLLCSALCWDQSFPDCWLTVATTARAECWAVTSPGSAQLW